MRPVEVQHIAAGGVSKDRIHHGDCLITTLLSNQKVPNTEMITFTMVLLCRMKVWKPNQRSFMQSSNATMTKASSSKVAWTYRSIKHAVTFISVWQETVFMCLSSLT